MSNYDRFMRLLAEDKPILMGDIVLAPPIERLLRYILDGTPHGDRTIYMNAIGSSTCVYALLDDWGVSLEAIFGDPMEETLTVTMSAVPPPSHLPDGDSVIIRNVFFSHGVRGSSDRFTVEGSSEAGKHYVRLETQEAVKLLTASFVDHPDVEMSLAMESI
ncbi:MAG: hypothetical protein CMF22_11840 [Idiomarinaceae bacterium]|nr:hypothetical protein [Idiomarinaceae bacterium]|tara:strand:+ start:36140 stop:36622 length:483 start_codon:yes stop_codon:yes gene_type:complete